MPNIRVKTEEDIAVLRQAGRKHGEILSDLYQFCKAGTGLLDIDKRARQLIREAGGEPAFLNYQPQGAARPFPAAVCVSVNDEIVHGIPQKNRTLKAGDIVSVDLGLIYKGRVTDAAFTKAVEPVDDQACELIKATRQALEAAVRAVKAGGRVGDVGAAVEKVSAGFPFFIIKHLAGHGVGHEVHEPPFIPNFGEAGQGPVLPDRAVIAIEPMLAIGSSEIKLEADDYTYSTADGSLSAHFEQTVLVTPNGPEVLTPLKF